MADPSSSTEKVDGGAAFPCYVSSDSSASASHLDDSSSSSSHLAWGASNPGGAPDFGQNDILSELSGNYGLDDHSGRSSHATTRVSGYGAGDSTRVLTPLEDSALARQAVSSNVQSMSYVLDDRAGTSTLATTRLSALAGGDGCVRSDSNWLKGKEMQDLLQYLKIRKINDPSFFYAIQVYETGEVANFFWADSKAIIDYAYFGDVILLTMTFLINDYEMLFAPIVGINHHKETIIFGAAILSDESLESFVWLFETFMAAMRRKQPITIFTYQSGAISKAIKIVMPNTCYRLCLWHIFQNATTNMSQVIHNFPHFLPLLKACIYEQSSVDKFEKLWSDLIEKYNLSQNNWIIMFYSIREKWASVYRGDSFCADMTTTHRSESINCAFKKFFKKKLCMLEFLEQYDKAIQYFREKEVHVDFKSRHTSPLQSYGYMAMLKEASLIYTKVIYDEFAEQYLSQLSCTCESINFDEYEETFKVTCLDTMIPHFVTYKANTLTIECSCKMFQCSGILCMHALRVLNVRNIFKLPQQYVLKRWTKQAKYGDSCSLSSPLIDSSGKEMLTLLYARVCQKAYNLSVKSMNSKKGLEILDKAIDEVAPQVEQAIHNDTESDYVFKGSNDVCMESCKITIRVPTVKKGPKEKKRKCT